MHPRALLPAFLALLGATTASSAEEAARNAMVEQVALLGVRDPRVLAAMRKIERHRFVPKSVRAQAYDDRPLYIGRGQTISEPYIVGRMTELLSLEGPERVLEIGTGSGYQAAVLGELVAEVYTMEIVPELAQDAARRLQELGHGNVHVRAGDGYRGWPEKAPFDAIIVTCAPEKVPPPLVAQLREGGRLVIPVGSFPLQTLYRMEKRRGELVARSVDPVLFVPMTGAASPDGGPPRTPAR